MPTLTEDSLTSNLANWLNDNRPEAIPATVPIHVANRDELRSRPCIVLATSDSKAVSGLPNTVRVKLDVHLFSQLDDTPADTHTAWASELMALLRQRATIQQDLNSESFCLHDLIPRESATTPDEQRGRETVLSFEAVLSAV